MRNPEIWIALIILGFLLFGAKKMPDAARGLGRSLRIFKAEMKGMEGDDQAQQSQQSQQHPTPQYQQAPQYPPQIPAGPQQPAYQQAAPVAAPADQNTERRDAQ